MMRPTAAIALFLAFSILQTGFFASLTGILAYTPLVVAIGIYLMQHAGERTGPFWIAGFGMFLDLLAIPSFPFETASYAAAGIVAYLSARHLFSNRSWYGLIACGMLSMLSLGAVRALVILGISLRHPERVSWITFGDTLIWNLILITLLLSVLFALARQIRAFLRLGYVVSRGRDPLKPYE